MNIVFFIFLLQLYSLLHFFKKEHKGALCAVQRKEVDWNYLLWGSFFSRIPSTPPSDFILRKKPPFLQYSRLGSLKLPGGNPPLPPSSGVAGRVVISPVAISSYFPLPSECFVSLLEQTRAGAPLRPPTSHQLLPVPFSPPPQG